MAQSALQIVKSSRHSKITGDFAEHLVLYWLSKHGFECARVDHTGIDLIARNPHTKELMGISVKSRSRSEGTEGTHVNIPRDSLDKAKHACQSFGCLPYFAVVVDQASQIHVFILSLRELESTFPAGRRVAVWKMTPQWVTRYANTPSIMYARFSSETVSWWRGRLTSRSS